MMSVHHFHPSRRTLLLATLTSAVSLQPVHAGSKPSLQSAADEPAFLAAFGVTAQMAVKYQDEDGRSLAREAFYERMARADGKLSFSIRKTPQDVTLQLQAPGKRPEGDPFKVAAGDLLPSFSLRSLDQETLSRDALKGRYTLMSFYFATCAPCVAEIPALNALQARMPELRLAAVTFDDEATSRRFVQDHGLRWPVYAQASSFLQALGVKSFPSFALLNPAGKLLSIGPLYALQNSEQPAEVLQRWVGEQIAKDVKESRESGKT